MRLDRDDSGPGSSNDAHEPDVKTHAPGRSSRASQGDPREALKAPPATEQVVLSFVMPAFNEERLIGGTIEAVRAHAGHLPHEIIVVDNGSTDATKQIAADAGARVVTRESGTIGALRNTAVQHATGKYVVFLDADVRLTAEWAARIEEALDMLDREPNALTGSICSVPADASWLERHWFEPRSARASSHLGTGHMILQRRFFNELGGFDERLATGEDYDLSQRARAMKGSIVVDQALRVEHLGYPRTLAAFLRREIWHGAGDQRALASIAKSKVALAASGFAVLHLTLLLGIVASGWVAAASAGGIAGICVLSAYAKYPDQGWRTILVAAGIFWVYYLGRAIALLRRPSKPESRVRG